MRRSHPRPPISSRERELADLLGHTLSSYQLACDMHPCDSCSTDLAVLTEQAGLLDVRDPRASDEG